MANDDLRFCMHCGSPTLMTPHSLVCFDCSRTGDSAIISIQSEKNEDLRNTEKGLRRFTDRIMELTKKEFSEYLGRARMNAVESQRRVENLMAEKGRLDEAARTAVSAFERCRQNPDGPEGDALSDAMEALSQILDDDGHDR